MATCIGTKPGDPLGSIVFDMLVTAVTSETEEEAKLQGVLVVMPSINDMNLTFHDCSAEVLMLDDVYADGSILVTADTHASAVPRKVAAMASIAVQVYERHGLRLNFKENKSEAMFRLAGPGSKDVYKQSAVHDEGWVEVQMPQESISLRVIVSFRHMGRHINSRGDMLPEAKARSGAATGVVSPGKKRVFANEAIDRTVRLSLAKSLSFSRLSYNAGTWDRLSAHAMRCIRRSYMQTYRTVAKMHNSQADATHTSDLQVLQAIQEPPIEVVLLTHRLSYLVRPIVHVLAALTRVVIPQLANKRSWVDIIIRDMSFLKNTPIHIMICPRLSSSQTSAFLIHIKALLSDFENFGMGKNM